MIQVPNSLSHPGPHKYRHKSLIIIKIEENKTDDTELNFKPVTEEYVDKQISNLNITKKSTRVWLYTTENLKIGTTSNLKSIKILVNKSIESWIYPISSYIDTRKLSFLQTIIS